MTERPHHKPHHGSGHHHDHEIKPKRDRMGGVDEEEFRFEPRTGRTRSRQQLLQAPKSMMSNLSTITDTSHSNDHSTTDLPSDISSKSKSSLQDIRKQQRLSYMRQSKSSRQAIDNLQQIYKNKMIDSVTNTLTEMGISKSKSPPAQVDKDPKSQLLEAHLSGGLDKALTPKHAKEAVLRNASKVHMFLYEVAESHFFSGFILIVILVNTILLILQTYETITVRGGWYFNVLEGFFLGIYVIECVIKIYAYRKYYFKEGWNILDFLIVIITVIDFGLPMILGYAGGFDGAAIFRFLRIFKAVRALRALRVLRTIRFLANLQVIMTTCLQSMQSMGAIVGLMMLFMYMFAVIGMGLYSKADPEHFANLGIALFTLFQILTLDDWFFIYTGVVKRDPGMSHILVFLIIYIVVEYFIFLNLFVAVLVDNFQLTLEAAEKARKKKKIDALYGDEAKEDEDDLYMPSTDSEVSYESLDNERILFPRKSMAEYYPQLRESERGLLEYHLQIMASLEYNHSLYKNEYETIHAIVDLCVDHSRAEK